jgi:hypothetical protein
MKTRTSKLRKILKGLDEGGEYLETIGLTRAQRRMIKAGDDIESLITEIEGRDFSPSDD